MPEPEADAAAARRGVFPTLITELTSALAERYRVDREIGQGGMATVYLAHDLKHDRDVALKVLRPELAATLGPERFLREIQIAARLQHPNILPVHDSGEAAGFLYYVMPFVEGLSLRERLSEHGELPVPEAVRILRDVADALAHAHAHGVLHRDIKPENIMLSGRHALVADFGVAKAVREATGRHQLTTVGVALGTPTYMAPEQASADPHADQRADMYAFGVTAYELLAGGPPFTGHTAQAVLAAHLTQVPAPVAGLRPSLPQPLAQLVMRCLEKKPADRPQSAEELLQVLESLATPSGGVTPAYTEALKAPARTRHHGVFSTLIAELRRRRVFQVAGLYIVAASAVIQGVTAILDNLHAPPAIATWLTVLIVAGFPVAVGISWAYDIRVERERAEDAGVGSRRLSPAGRLLFALGVVVGMAVLGVVAARVVRRTAQGLAPTVVLPPPARPGVAVYKVELSGAKDEGFAALLQSALTDAIGIGAERGVSVRGVDLVNSYRAKSLPLDSLAALLGIDYLVGGWVTVSDSGMQLSVQVLDRRGTLVGTPRSFSAGPAALESTVELQELTRKAADYVLGVVGAEVQAKHWELGTGSMPALRAFSDANEATAFADQLLDQPDMGQARSMLADADRLLGEAMAADPKWSEPAVRRAELAIRQAAAARSDTAAALRHLLAGIALADRVLRQHPANASALSVRGTLRFHEMQQTQLDSATRATLARQARQDLERALQLDRTLVGTVAQLASFLHSTGDFVGARTQAQRALSLDAYQLRAAQLTYLLAISTFETGDDTTALRLCQEGLRRFGDVPSLQGCALEVNAFGDIPPDVAGAWQGLAHLRKATRDDPETMAYYELAMAAVLARAGLRDSARHVLVRTRRTRAAQFTNANMLWIEAAVRHRLGGADADSATALLRAWQERHPPVPQYILNRRAVRSFSGRAATDQPRR